MIGKQIAHYSIEAKLGEGGMGEVYLAEDTSLDRKVALKFLPPSHQEDKVAHRRFVREAKSAAALDHPYICHINEVAQTDDGQDFIVMEYVEGQTLKERLEEGRITLSEVIKLASEISEALEQAHSKGVVHRDLKPANIMLTSTGHAKVMDFGLAKRITGNDEDLTTVLTRHGSTLGTLAYMSPEQLKGKELDARSDIFSFGVVLYEMLTGVHPFRGGTAAETMAAILDKGIVAFGDYLEEVPALLQHTIGKTLAKHPDQRYQTIHEVRINLEEIGKVSSLQAAVPQELGSHAENKKTVWFVLGISAVVLLVVSLALSRWLPFPEEGTDSTRILKPFPFTTLPGRELYPDFSPDGGRMVFAREDPESMIQDLFVKQIGPGDLLRLTNDSHVERFPCWSPDGQLVAFARWFPERGKIAIVTVPALGGLETTRAEVGINLGREPGEDRGVNGLSWTPDGKQLAVSYRPADQDEARVFLLSVATGEMEPLTFPPRGSLGDYYPAVSPDGSQIAFFRRTDYGIWVPHTQPLSSRTSKAPTSQKFLGAWGLAWLPDGNEFVFSAGPTDSPILWIVSSPEGNPVPLTGSGEYVSKRWPAVSKHGGRLAYEERAGRRSDIWRIEVPQSSSRPIAASTRVDIRAKLSPDGSRLVFCSNRTGFMEIFVSHSDGSDIRQITDFKNYSGSAQWSPDGRQIAFDSYLDGDLNIYLANPDTGAHRKMTASPATDAMPTWSQDGRWLYFMSNRTGRSEIWKMGLETRETFQVTQGGGWFGRESFDGRHLYFQKFDAGEVWKKRLGGEGETPVLRQEIRPYNWDLTSRGIYYSTRRQTDQGWLMTVRFLEFSSGENREVLTEVLEGLPSGLGVSPDGREFVFAALSTIDNADLMLVENFR